MIVFIGWVIAVGLFSLLMLGAMTLFKSREIERPDIAEDAFPLHYRSPLLPPPDRRLMEMVNGKKDSHRPFVFPGLVEEERNPPQGPCSTVVVTQAEIDARVKPAYDDPLLLYPDNTKGDE